MHRPTVGIDLGASYTKVSYRCPLQQLDRSEVAGMNTDIVLIDGSATIPSLMIKTGDPRRPWVAGAEAAGMSPAPKMEVFENWKSALYSSDFDVHKVRLVTLAGHFFGWLQERLSECGVNLVEECRVRVTIPGLKRIEDRKDVLIECMRLNGWPDSIEVVKEPVANLLGVLSGGQNYVSPGGRMHYWLTIGSDDGTNRRDCAYIFGEIRRFASGYRSDRNMAISVVDFGSFTLDVARMTLDLNVIEYAIFPINEIVEESWEVGVIEYLDKPCLSEVVKNNSIEQRLLSFHVRELAKKELYAGKEFAVPGTRTILGRSEADKRVVKSTVARYCEESWSLISPHCKGSEFVVLTGGGACIPAVQDFVVDKLKKSGVKHIVGSAQGEGSVVEGRETRFADWFVSGQSLERVATGLGAASVGFGFSQV